MSLVSPVGRKSARVRLLFLGMYLLLSIGAITMVYPFLMMVTMSTTGKADYSEYKLIPRFWVSESALMKKYILDSAPLDDLSVRFGKDTWFVPFDVKEDELKSVLEMPATQRKTMASDVRTFISGVCPNEFKVPLFDQDIDSPLALQTEYYAWLKSKYKRLEAVNLRYPDNANTWEELGIPSDQMQRRPERSPRMRDWRKFLETRTPERTGIYNVDEDVYVYLRTVPLPKKCENANLACITYDDIASGKFGEQAKADFLRTKAWARFIRIDIFKALPAWRSFLAEKKKSGSISLTSRIPADESRAGLWGQFIQSGCPISAISYDTPENHWRRYIGKKYGDIAALNKAYGSHYGSFEEARIPYAAFLCDNFKSRQAELRQKYLWHNFASVFGFIALHGSALWVTVIFIALTIGTTLTVNPLAAYAMSRFRLKESYHVLIFLLATMAFPGEVLMIPGFLMIKSFPVAQILAIAACLLAFLITMKLKRRVSPIIGVSIAALVTLTIAGWVVPHLTNAMHVKSSVSLMNTFWALILPGMANGYGIFLLKGFFDSLPPELYEAGLIDGASEITMFRKITLPLCKPILAVLALGAFSAAYGAFMHAFLVCQNPKMWTLMVFLYEFQQNHGVPMVMASLVISAVPTLLVFLFCQNIILRGIVIPTYK